MRPIRNLNGISQITYTEEFINSLSNKNRLNMYSSSGYLGDLLYGGMKIQIYLIIFIILSAIFFHFK